MAARRGVAILGIFVADLAFRAGRMPGIGETIAGTGFKMGPGGKGSNQAVAAARVGAAVTFISRIGRDEFGAIAEATWRKEGIAARVVRSDSEPTGAAFIYVNDRTGENAIIVVPGAAASIGAEEIDAAADAITGAAVFVTQLEQPVPAARRGLGYTIQASSVDFNVAMMFACVVILSIMGVTASQIVKFAHRRIAFWERRTGSGASQIV